MRNRITVSIGGQKYHLTATEDEEYTRRVAAEVDKKIRETMTDDKASIIDGAILAAMNLADEKFKEQEISENLRRQLKELLEESSRLKGELSEAKREIFKLSQKK